MKRPFSVWFGFFLVDLLGWLMIGSAILCVGAAIFLITTGALS